MRPNDVAPGDMILAESRIDDESRCESPAARQDVSSQHSMPHDVQRAPLRVEPHMLAGSPYGRDELTASSSEGTAAPEVDEGRQPDEIQTEQYVYAMGRVEARFPNLSVEREFAQVAGRVATAKMTDSQVRHAVLSHPDHVYLAREVCWIFTVQGLPHYVLLHRHPDHLEALLRAIDPEAPEFEVVVVIGTRGPFARPEHCDGLAVPVVLLDMVYGFRRADLINAIPVPKTDEEKPFKAAAGELVDHVMQLADNAGATDEHRALNYLVNRYPGIYGAIAEAYREEKTFTGVDVVDSRLGTFEAVRDVILSFTHRATNVTDRRFVRVDVSGKYPFLVSGLQQFYDR